MQAMGDDGGNMEGNYIRHLRQKIETNPNDPKLIHTEIGVGYRIAEAS